VKKIINWERKDRNLNKKMKSQREAKQ